MTDIQFSTDDEIDNAIRAVLCAAFCAEDAEELRRVVRLRLPSAPTPVQIVDAVCAELRWRGRLEFEDLRRLRSEEHTSELQSPLQLLCRLLLVKKKNTNRLL